MNWKTRIEEIKSGYKDAAVLLSAVQVGIFDALGTEWKTSSEIAENLELDPRAVDAVMRALVAIGIVQFKDESFFTEPEARPLLLLDSPDTIANILNHNLSQMHLWVKLEDVLRTGQPVPRPRWTDRELRNFICGMENVSRTSSAEVVEKLDLSGARRLLDLGGGPGTAAITFAKANPNLECVVFDLAAPLEIAKEQIAAANLADRVTTAVGDFNTDAYGDNFDVVYISNVIHMLGEDETLAMLLKARQALVPGGLLVIKEFFVEDSRVEPAAAALFNVNMLVATENGKTYTRSETQDLMTSAGFGSFNVYEVATTSELVTGIVV